MNNILSIDVESWIHFYQDAVKQTRVLSSAERKELDGGYVREAIDKLLNLLVKYKARATFFLVSEIYDWYPEAVQAIARAGHEIGYHTFQHTVLTSGELLRQELEQSKNFLERFRPKGFRAPQITLPADGYEYLKANGFIYSSSTYDHRGKTSIKGLDEIPVTTIPWRSSATISPNNAAHLPRKLSLSFLAHSWPAGSGLSLPFGFLFMKKMIQAVNKKGQPFMLFLHPWQLYDHPKIRGLRFLRAIAWRNPFCVPYIVNVSRTLDCLLQEFAFVSCEEYYYNSLRAQLPSKREK